VCGEGHKKWSRPHFTLTFNPGSCYACAEAITMPQTIHVIYENGVLKPLGKVDIAEHRTLEILILEDDLPLSLIGRVAEQGGSYDFLHHAAEDIYTTDDGEAV
jgi:predicted DNA-binding antitoxin AbrB/MazE fold protein